MHNNAEELLQRAKMFDQAALAEMYDRFSPGLYTYSMRLLGDSNLAEDCVSETFSRLIQAISKGRGPRDYLQAYIYRIAHNWITDRYRRNRDQWEELKEETRDSEEERPVQIADCNFRQERLRKALLCLTPEQRQVVVLRFIEEWDLKLVAHAIGKPLGATKALQHRAMIALRKVLSLEEL